MIEQTNIYNFKQITNCVAIGGQLDKLQYAQLHQQGFEAIIQINIQEDKYSQTTEEFFSHINEMEYSAMDISFSSLTVEKATEFTELMQQHEGKKIYVHCTAGFYTSLLMVVYQMIRYGLDQETAIENCAVDNWTLKSQWQYFIDCVLFSYSTIVHQGKLSATAFA